MITTEHFQSIKRAIDSAHGVVTRSFLVRVDVVEKISYEGTPAETHSFHIDSIRTGLASQGGVKEVSVVETGKEEVGLLFHFDGKYETFFVVRLEKAI